MNHDDHRAAIARLSPEETGLLTARADAPGLRRLLFHAGGIVVLGALILAGVPGWPLLLLPQGILIAFLFTAEHEAIHGTAFRTSWLNAAVAGASGLLLLLPPRWFRFFHFAHHRHTQDPDLDPELMGPKPETPGQYALYLSGLPYWTSLARSLGRNALGRGAEPFVPPRGAAKVRGEARLFLGLYAALGAVSLLLGTAALLWLWIVPAALGQPFLRAFVLAEHARCPMVSDMLQNTRTTLTNRLVRLVSWNMPFHAEHHSFPAVPFHKLPALHGLIGERVRVKEEGYGRFHAGFVRGMGEAGPA